MPLIEINGKPVDAEAGKMIIEVADSNQVAIPRFCYHKKLSIAASCRMCLVEVERAPKPVPACATPIAEGMKIWTRSPKVLMAQKAVMEFLLINHPLDCPVCDQGGECELQDTSLRYGKEVSRYTEEKRVVVDQDLGPLIATEMTRCIQCTRCVRFGREIAGVPELGAVGRGESVQIESYLAQSVDSEVSGNVIDLCPVGALTSKPYRFTARGWELKQTPSLSPHDGVGSHLYLHTRGEKVMRVIAREHEPINEMWISDRDRFSYEALSHPERLLHPKMKKEGQWETISWEEALEYTANALLNVIAEEGAHSAGGWISPNATVEECYLFQKWLKGLGVHNIDYRLQQNDLQHWDHPYSFPHHPIALTEIEQQSLIFLVGTHLHKEQPILGLKVRRMTLLGGKALVLNPIELPFNFEVALQDIVSQGTLEIGLSKIAKAIAKIQNRSLEEVPFLHAVEPEKVHTQMAEALIQADKKLILLGAYAKSHPAYSKIVRLAHWISTETGTRVVVLNEGANSAGALLAGCVPHALVGGEESAFRGLNWKEMIDTPLSAYVLMNLEPHLDCVAGPKALAALKQAKQVIALSLFESEALLDVADILLPLSSFAETAGTFVNLEGKWQTFKAGVKPLKESQPGWKILRVLGNVCGLPGFDYTTTEAVLADLNETLNQLPQHSVPLRFKEMSLCEPDGEAIIRLAPLPLYATDSLVRRASSLQKQKDAGTACVYLNAALAERLALKGENVQIQWEGHLLQLPYFIDARLPHNTVLIEAGLLETAVLEGPYSVITLHAIH